MMLNGAFFTPSGEEASESYIKASSMVARPSSVLTKTAQYAVCKNLTQLQSNMSYVCKQYTGNVEEKKEKTGPDTDHIRYRNQKIKLGFGRREEHEWDK
ncbi:hypothetical protein Gohar_021183 [Gossypium harknessii]|uniref:Uncharacterized protein n=1 Tax=Gossypium harknessii TaxID=34285 RepID=A0A7J9IBJ6_9ROSI|nr:hypothetical protein [Gossypium harknessii]